jgi:hypothetical protein
VVIREQPPLFAKAPRVMQIVSVRGERGVQQRRDYHRQNRKHRNRDYTLNERKPRLVFEVLLSEILDSFHDFPSLYWD